MSYSIIIPIHNEEQNIRPLLNNLKKFSLKNEILIIDDGSTDNSIQIITKYPFVKIIKLMHNSGKGIAIKKGLESAISLIIFTNGYLVII